MTIVNLKSSDHEIHEIEKSLAKCVKPWRLILEQDEATELIDVKAKSFHLHFILEWLEKHKDDDVVLHPPLVTVPEVIATLRESNPTLLTAQQLSATASSLDSLLPAPTNWDRSYLRHIPRKELGTLLKLATELEIKVLGEYLSDHLLRTIHLEQQWLRFGGDVNFM